MPVPKACQIARGKFSKIATKPRSTKKQLSAAKKALDKACGARGGLGAISSAQMADLEKALHAVLDSNDAAEREKIRAAYTKKWGPLTPRRHRR